MNAKSPANVPRTSSTYSFCFFFCRKGSTKHRFNDVISSITYAHSLWPGILPGKVCPERGDPHDGHSDVYTRASWEKSMVKQFPKASRLNVQGNHSGVFPRHRVSQYLCLTVPSTTPFFWKMSRYNLCKNGSPSACHRTVGYEKLRPWGWGQGETYMVIKC